MYSGDSGFEFGVDPNLDPELALVRNHFYVIPYRYRLSYSKKALRLSIEEARARQEAENQTQEGNDNRANAEAREQDGNQNTPMESADTANEVIARPPPV